MSMPQIVKPYLGEGPVTGEKPDPLLTEAVRPQR